MINMKSFKFIIIAFTIIFISSIFSVTPKLPYCGQIIKLNINLNELGILKLDKSKSFLKTTSSQINIISYKIIEKNNISILQIYFQIFLSGNVNLADLIFFDGISYYNFNSITIQMNPKIDEQYYLQESKKFNKFIFNYLVIIYIIFIFSSFIAYYLLTKIKKEISIYFDKKKIAAKIQEIMIFAKKIEASIVVDSISDNDYKNYLIAFNEKISYLLNLNFNSSNIIEKIQKINLLNSNLKVFSYDAPFNILATRKNEINNIIEKIISEIEKIMTLIIEKPKKLH